MSSGNPQVSAGLSLPGEVKKLGANSLIYLLPNMLVRGLSFLLMPVYTRVMTPEDYGIVGVASTLAPLLTTVLGFSIHSAASRLHFDVDDDGDRKNLYSSILIFLAVVPLGITLGLYLAGSLGLLDLFVTVRFNPHLRLVLWTAYFGVFPGLVVNIFVARESPRRVALFSLVSLLITVAAMMVFVVGLRQGAIGQLRATLVSSAVIAAIAVCWVIRIAPIRFSRELLKKAIRYSVPLVPHLLSTWALAAADRVVLERYVSKGEVGRYSLAYTFATVSFMTANAISMAFLPVVTRRLHAGDPAGTVPRLGTYVLLPTVFVSLAVSLLSADVICLITGPDYHRAGAVVPWIVVGGVFQALYAVSSQGTFFSKRTRAVPIVTAIGAAVNIGLNLVTVPRWGIMAAAVNTAIAYALLAVMHGVLAHRLYPIAWEYGRWMVLLLCAAATFLAGQLGIHLGPWLNLMAKTALLLTLFPALLVLCGFPRGGELTRFRELLGRVRRAT